MAHHTATANGTSHSHISQISTLQLHILEP